MGGNSKTNEEMKTKGAIRRLVRNIAEHIDPDVEVSVLSFTDSKEAKYKKK